MQKGAFWGFTFAVLLLPYVWVLITPPWQAPDEPTHYDYAWAIAEYGFDLQAIDKTAAARTAAIFESMDRHDFYYLTYHPRPATAPQSLATAPLLDDSMTKVGKPPLGYIFYALVVRLVGPANVIKGLLIGRLLSATLTSVSLALIFLSARLITGPTSYVPYFGLLIVGTNPQFLHIGASFSSDPLMVMWSSLLLYLLLRSFLNGLTVKLAMMGSVVILASLLTKKNGWLLLGAVLLSLKMIGLSKSIPRKWLLGTALCFVGGWLATLAWLIPDTLRVLLLRDFVDMVTAPLSVVFFPGRILIPFRKAPLLGMSFFGYFGWTTHRLHSSNYLLLLPFYLSACWGLYRKYRSSERRGRLLIRGLITWILVISVGAMLRSMSSDEAAQGRYLYTALPALALACALGFSHVRGTLLRLTTLGGLVLYAGIATSSAIAHFHKPLTERGELFMLCELIERFAFPEPDQVMLRVDAGTLNARAVMMGSFYPDEEIDDFSYAWAGKQVSLALYEFGGSPRVLGMHVLPCLTDREQVRRLTLRGRAEAAPAHVALKESWRWIETVLPLALPQWGTIVIAADRVVRPQLAEVRDLAWAIDEFYVRNLYREPNLSIDLGREGMTIEGSGRIGFNLLLQADEQLTMHFAREWESRPAVFYYQGGTKQIVPVAENKLEIDTISQGRPLLVGIESKSSDSALKPFITGLELHSKLPLNDLFRGLATLTGNPQTKFPGIFVTSILLLNTLTAIALMVSFLRSESTTR